MIRLAPLFLMIVALPAQAQNVPTLSEDNPRLQSVRYVAGERVLLTALPRSALTVILEPGEQIQQVILGTQSGYLIRVSPERDSFTVLPEAGAPETTLTVQTEYRSYQFDLRTGSGLLAAYLVKFEFSQEGGNTASALPQEPKGPIWSYRLKGDRSVRPKLVLDDGIRTWVTFGEAQALPAVFAIGPNGKEQVVNGYMRGQDYVIDRVYGELVFRIDKEKASAKRSDFAEPSA